MWTTGRDNPYAEAVNHTGQDLRVYRACVPSHLQIRILRYQQHIKRYPTNKMRTALALSAVALLLALVDTVFSSEHQEVYYTYPEQLIRQDGFVRQRRSPQDLKIEGRGGSNYGNLRADASYPIIDNDRTRLDATGSYQRSWPGHPRDTQTGSLGLRGTQKIWESGNHRVDANGEYQRNFGANPHREDWKVGATYTYRFP